MHCLKWVEDKLLLLHPILIRKDIAAIMSALSSNREIIELTESYDSEFRDRRDTGERHLGKTSKKHSIEDDINKLFEAIEIGSKGFEHPERRFREKSAMKRPMRVAPSQALGIGISESASLKQALRGLCISQASEMAAVKKRLSRPSISPGVSESGAIKKLYRAVVVESREDGQSQTSDAVKRRMVEISIVPETSSSYMSHKTPESGLGSIAEVSERNGQSSVSLVDDGDKNGHDDQTSKADHQTLDSAVENGCEESEKVSPSSTVDPNASKHGYVPPLCCKTKSTVTKADERSRSGEKGEFSQSSNSIGEYSSTTSYSEESYLSGSSRSGHRPHMSKDLRWEAISSVQGSLGMKHFKLLKKIGSGDIGIVYLSELIGTSCLFAMKVIDNDFLVSRNKMHRAQTEKEILEILDHPFLPTLYGHFTTKKYSCLVMEYCPGGDLHVLRQRQLSRSFPEKAARFYAAEILLALEYLHMLGVVYRDLKPENILVRENGHIMLSDFDLSLRCTVNPMLLKPSSLVIEPPKKASSPCSNSSCIDPFCLQPSWQLSCFTSRFLTKTRKIKSELAAQVIPLPQLIVEPVAARSNSFVGTHEYLAPEIIRGEGHGSAVDWWTFGIFLYELLYGRTPFKGSSNEETISNVVSQCLKFPECPMASCHARDLIRRLLKKEPEDRLGSAKGAAEIKQHAFFEGLNWALIRCESPPELPRSFDVRSVVDTVSRSKKIKASVEFGNGGDEIEFEMF